MKKINFEKLKMYQDIGKINPILVNVKSDFSNLIYNRAPGIQYHALALKIYNSIGETEYTDEECELIKQFATQCTPAFMDAIEEVLK